MICRTAFGLNGPESPSGEGAWGDIDQGRHCAIEWPNAKYIREDVAAPNVKQLKWEETPARGLKRGIVIGSFGGKMQAMISRTDFGWGYMGDVYLTAQSDLDGALVQAKSAAQADYERRILRALE